MGSPSGSTSPSRTRALPPSTCTRCFRNNGRAFGWTRNLPAPEASHGSVFPAREEVRPDRLSSPIGRYALIIGASMSRVVSHYQLEDEIGRGSMGVVYRATDLRLGRPVALKMLHAAATADHDRHARFVREARTASALNH